MFFTCAIHVLVQMWVRAINEVLMTARRKRPAAIKAMVEKLNPPKFVKINNDIFLNGDLVAWDAPENVLETVPGKLSLRCTVCDEVYKWSGVERVIKHILSKSHHKCCKQKLKAKETARAKALLDEQIKIQARAKDVIKYVTTFATQYGVAKSLPFSATVMALDCVTATLKTIVASEISSKCIALLQKHGHKQEAGMMASLQTLTASADMGGRRVPTLKRKNGQPLPPPRTKRSRFRLHRTTVAKRVINIAATIKEKKATYLGACPYVSLILDEGNNYRRSCPLYAATMSCDREFRWRTQFVGQANCEGSKTGKNIHELTKGIFISNGLLSVWDNLEAVATDGASAMRSTCDYAGLDARGVIGESFVAYLKRDVKEDLDAWHGLCHQMDRGLNDAMDAIETLKLFYLPHVRMCHSEFKRSSVNRTELKALTDTPWEVFYPKLHVATRWLSMKKVATTMAVKNSRALLKRYAQGLRDRGLGARAFDPYRYHRRRQNRDAEEAGNDNRDGEGSDAEGSDAEDDQQDVERVQEAMEGDRDGYHRQPQRFPSAEAAAAAAPEQQDMVDADDFDTGRDGARGRKCKNLLNRDVGLTDLNFGRSAYLAGVLKPYAVLIEELQRVHPEQHWCARRIRKFYMVMQTSWVGSATQTPVYAGREFREWCDEMEALDKEDLVDLVKKECRSFSGVILASIKVRLSHTWASIQALELIDPLGPELGRFATDEVWAALKDLCSRRGLDYDLCKEQIVEMRSAADGLHADDRQLIKLDLCGYMRERHAGFVAANRPSPTEEYDKLCCAVFSIPLTSSFVESLFSKMEYNQGKARSRLKDETMSAILHCHDAALPDPEKRLTGDLQLKVTVPKSIRDKLVMHKQIGTRVCEVFEGDRYHGEVTKIIFHDVHAQFMYHVVWEDGDECDYWRHELEMVMCRCEDSSDQSDSDS